MIRFVPFLVTAVALFNLGLALPYNQGFQLEPAQYGHQNPIIAAPTKSSTVEGTQNKNSDL